MLIDTLFDTLVRRINSRRQKPGELSSYPDEIKTGSRKSNSRQRHSGIFNNANNFVINKSTIIENRGKIVQQFATGNSVLELIAPYTDPDAAVDSSARFPPPLCHPGTRLEIGSRLTNWFGNHNRQWNMMWLHGPAGTGKSAAAQMFAERSAAGGHLGASFFFSRSNGRDDPDTVIPTLAYQLAVCHPKYKSLLTAQLAGDPQLLRKARHIQFKCLIVEPFSQLQNQKYKDIQGPFLIVLDGLDECRGERAQREFIEMISEVVRLKKDLPLLWLVCSRPEAHLKYIFSTPDFVVNCGREELAIDAESIADVDLYLRDGLVGIRDEFQDVTTPTWPSEDQIAKLSDKASGHFGFAATALRYIGDLTYATPVARLDTLLSFLEGIRVGTTNPLEALDALYTRILDDVPAEFLPTIKRILGYLIFLYGPGPDYVDFVQPMCNFLQIGQADFYSAFRKLHSVIDLPSPEAACDTVLRFYHASFEDYLRDPSRSGKFTIGYQDAHLDFAKLCLSWYKTNLTLFHTGGLDFNEFHQSGILPDLKWTSDTNRAQISSEIARVATQYCWWGCDAITWDNALLSQIQNFDFRYIRADKLSDDWSAFINKLWGVDSPSDTIRTTPKNGVDLQLIEYTKYMTKSSKPFIPATFPLDLNSYHKGDYKRKYFLVGHGSNTVVCCLSQWGRREYRFDILNLDEVFSRARANDYREWLAKECPQLEAGDDEERGQDNGGETTNIA